MKGLTREARRHREKSGNRVRNAWKLFRDILAEVFDESAYQRFLRRTNDVATNESYRAFLRERETTIAKKPRCC
jgi:hypothetical protein